MGKARQDLNGPPSGTRRGVEMTTATIKRFLDGDKFGGTGCGPSDTSKPIFGYRFVLRYRTPINATGEQCLAQLDHAFGLFGFEDEVRKTALEQVAGIFSGNVPAPVTSLATLEFVDALDSMSERTAECSVKPLGNNWITLNDDKGWSVTNTASIFSSPRGSIDSNTSFAVNHSSEISVSGLANRCDLHRLSDGTVHGLTPWADATVRPCENGKSQEAAEMTARRYITE